MKPISPALIVLLCAVPATGNETVDFNRDVRPILSKRCFQCHGPDEHERQAELRLDQADGPDGAYRVVDGSHAIKPGSVVESELWKRITSTEDDVMPPADSDQPPLTADERQVIRRWIEQGARYADFWAFVPPRMPAIPESDRDSWNRHPIDQLVWRTLDTKGLQPKPPADPRTLIRRLSLDLTGLPPTRAEIQQFLNDQSPEAYERLVDRLLASPHFGEHMARYWLDLVRFADTNGIHHDHFRDMSPYRDWVIRSFNDNLPYDDFTRYQLAGDLYPQPTSDQLVASGFNRLHLIIDRGTALPEESFTRNVIDRVTAVGTAFMGLTVQCAVCHDHKYDPVTSRDFYQLFAFFNNFDGDPETGGRQGTDFRRGLQPPYISLATEVQAEQLKQFKQQLDKLQGEIEQLKKQAASQPDPGQKQQLEAQVKQLEQSRKQIDQQRSVLEETIPVAMVMKERADRRPAHILIRGAYDKPGEEVQPNTPAFLTPLAKNSDGLPTRMDLANWFVARENPLTARVAVNRFWQQLFGVGIVKTAEDFGAQGDWPSHPELLDYLAVTFMESGWDVKNLMKHVVMSETYRQSSRATPEEYKRDPENRLLARGSRFRLDAEVIRDQILATSGLLNEELFGKSVKPPQPEGLWETVSMPSSYPRTYEPDTGNQIYRRSVYTFWKRGMPPPQMTILNAPTREACIARRERTNTPLQALLLMNEPEFLKAARHLALHSLTAAAESPEQRVVELYETITSKQPDAQATSEFLAAVRDLESIYGDEPELARKLCAGVEVPPSVTMHRLAAWTMLASTIYNLDMTKTRE